MIQHGVTGLLAKPEDLNDFCKHIMTLVAQPAIGKRMGPAAREFVIREHAAATIAEQTEAFYLQAIAQHKQ